MPKTITIRIEDDVYEIFKNTANDTRRSISNFVEYATLAYLTNEMHVSDEVMNEILNNAVLVKSIQKGLDDIKKGNYKIVS